MSRLPGFKGTGVRRVTLALPLCLLFVAGLGMLRSAAQNGGNDLPAYPISGLADGIGSQVVLAPTSANSSQVTASVNSVVSFIGWRSGISIDSSSASQLASLELATLNGSNPTIDSCSLAAYLAGLTTAEVANFSDDDVSFVTDVLQANGSSILISNVGPGGTAASFSSEEFSGALNDLISSGGGPDTEQQATDALNGLIAAYLNVLVTSDPAQFGNVTVDANGVYHGMTPVQAALVAYGVLANDPLTFSQDELEFGMAAPEYEGRPVSGYAYGSYGGVYSSPVDLFFNLQPGDRFTGFHNMLNMFYGPQAPCGAGGGGD